MQNPRPLPNDDDGLLDLNMLRVQPLTPADRIDVGRRLVRRALDRRDADAARLAAEWMDADPALDEELYERLERAVNIQPDAVYNFVRVVLAAQQEAEAPPARASVWRERLKVAALASLQVAITDGDADTVMSWLKLIAREPAGYDLSGVLAAGIAASRKRALVEPDLARGLVLLSARRSPAMLEELLHDEVLRGQLPDALCEALQYGEGDAQRLFDLFGAEVFLSALYRANGLHKPNLITAGAVERVWALAEGDNGSAALAEKLLKQWGGAENLGWLQLTALRALLVGALRHQRDEQFYALAAHMAGSPGLPAPALFGGAIADAERTVVEAQAIIAQLTAAGTLDYAGAAGAYVALLDAAGWREEAFAWVESLARMLQQNADISLPPEVLWRMVEAAADLREDFAARAAVRRLTAQFEAYEDEGDFSEALARLAGYLNWAGGARASLLAWWREYMHTAPNARLQRIERLLPEKAGDGRRLDDVRGILSTALAMRRMLGKRTFGEFAADVATTFQVMQAVVEAFEPTAKRAVLFDAATLRAELDSQVEALPPHERKIVANDLKELAALVTHMAEGRSRPTLVRRQEDIDRLLTTGDIDPHGAVDTLKWLAGYLSGSQPDDE